MCKGPIGNRWAPYTLLVLGAFALHNIEEALTNQSAFYNDLPPDLLWLTKHRRQSA
jgi:hypothetical protein